jgi:hypothetical protein
MERKKEVREFSRGNNQLAVRRLTNKWKGKTFIIQRVLERIVSATSLSLSAFVAAWRVCFSTRKGIK